MYGKATVIGRARWIMLRLNLTGIIWSNGKGVTMSKFIKALCLAAFFVFSVGTLNTAHASTTLLDITIADGGEEEECEEGGEGEEKCEDDEEM